MSLLPHWYYWQHLFHDGIKNILYALSGNKKIKMDDYKNDYLLLNKILINTLYLVNPNEKIMFKVGQESTNDRLLLGYYNIFFQRICHTVPAIKKMVFNLEIMEYNTIKHEYNYIKKINRINDKAKFKLTPKLVGIFLKKKDKRKKFFLEENEEDKEKDENNNK